MKQLKFMVCLVAVLTSLVMTSQRAEGQQRICEAQSPTIICAGSFNNGTTTALTNWTSINNANFPDLQTELDNVIISVPDTFKTQIVGEYNSVGFGFDVAKIAGRTDSFTVKVYATKKVSPEVGDYALLATLTVPNNSTFLNYDVNSGRGNPNTSYMFVLSTTNAATGSQASWRGWQLVR